jgi:sulfoxide reductase heme-binding subunit YedZ
MLRTTASVKRLKLAILAVASVLVLHLLFIYFTESHNVYRVLMLRTGEYTLLFLTLSLSITPLRRWFTIISQKLLLAHGKRLSDWNWMIKIRRRIGLISAFFCVLHLSVYVWLEMGLIWSELLWDAKSRNFVAIGWLSFLIMSILAITSPDSIQKRLKRNWRRIHRSVYLLALLSLLHFGIGEKAGQYNVVPWAVIMAALLTHRVWFSLKRDAKSLADDGMSANR